MSSKVRADDPGRFAVHDDHLLLQGYVSDPEDREPHEYHPSGRIYLVSLKNDPAIDVRPVNDNGEWIGPFRSYGRGSVLYLLTSDALYSIDAATIQAKFSE